MGRVAIVKPDHLGDLVLASPAMRAIWNRFGGGVEFFVSSATIPLLRYFFPDAAEVHRADLSHLAKGHSVNITALELGDRLRRFDTVFFLRDDEALRQAASCLSKAYVFGEGGHLTHDTAIQKRAIEGVIGSYSRTAHFSGTAIFWPKEIRSVGLCVAAGFPTNRWPNVYWMKLAQLLANEGIKPVLIGGPGERDELRVMSTALGSIPHNVIEGGADFGAFFERLTQVDLVVASDGGTAHLCSTKKPILSIFGSSPWRRYAPFGWNNVLITRDLACSPCVQFSSEEVNGCLSRECSAGITPDNVFRVIFSGGMDFSHLRGAKAFRGVSHAYEN
jgi:ADP-heptose:LPS heptosyltransferase